MRVSMRRFLRLPNRIPVRLPDRQAGLKWLAALIIAAAATLIAVGWRHTAVLSIPMGKVDDFLYDEVYRLRTPEDRRDGNVVIVAISQEALTKLNQGNLDEVRISWPWPRELYGEMVQYFERCGARVVAFDMLFNEQGRNAEQLSDETFAEMVAESKLPVVFATQATVDGKPGPFAPPIKDPTFGAVNTPGLTLRDYRPFVNGFPSLAFRTATIFAGGKEPQRRGEFLLHFYGPHKLGKDRHTFPYMDAYNVLAAVRGMEKEAGLSPEVFRDKIVLVGATAASLYDAKVTPLDDSYPGAEWQATAIENLLHNQRVLGIPLPVSILITFAGSFAAAAGSLVPRRTSTKLVACVFATAAVIALAIWLFRGEQIRWLRLAEPLAALLISTVAAFAWSYFTEGRQRLFISKAFALSTSQVIADAISKNPEKLKLGGERREITVMFTDLAGFTDLSETMEVEDLAKVINLYMEAMSDEIVTRDGYLDKYIGDAIMSFWNGLVDQPDHAVRACRAALGIKKRELEIAPELQKLVEAKIVTRIGVHCGPMAVGNLGSSRKLSYTVLGDAVNLAARLEPANKLYDTEVLISQTVAEQVKGGFVIRELDLLRVKGKQKPMAVFELIAEGQPTPAQQRRIERYSQGLTAYRGMRWDDADEALQTLLNEFPDDGPAAAILKRIQKLRHDPPAPGWDGVYVAKEK
jgi:adenylate cyclase